MFVYCCIREQWPDFGCEGIKVQRAHQPTSQCQGKKRIHQSFYLLVFEQLQTRVLNCELVSQCNCNITFDLSQFYSYECCQNISTLYLTVISSLIILPVAPTINMQQDSRQIFNDCRVC
eukprot:TRINITY_DN8605_c0_g1_i1.p2 TRINITY_DN8605_c0_g1~~TRINITY_DN8605_c0_g1_i1.p2  ORF type:complete len:119 (+),score=9.45 TRINITY_DN8605_c0_g1_i1:100-456(+)